MCGPPIDKRAARISAARKTFPVGARALLPVQVHHHAECGQVVVRINQNVTPAPLHQALTIASVLDLQVEPSAVATPYLEPLHEGQTVIVAGTTVVGTIKRVDDDGRYLCKTILGEWFNATRAALSTL